MKRNFKKICSLLVVISIVLSMGAISFAEQKVVSVFVDGVQLSFDVNPIIYEGRTLVPMRLIFEALGAKVDWIDETKTAVGVKDGIKIEISINDKKLIKNGEAIELDVPAMLISSRTLVPVRAISESFGCEVGWDGELYKVTITGKNTGASLSEKELEELAKLDAELNQGFKEIVLPKLASVAKDDMKSYIQSKNEDGLKLIDLFYEFTYATAIEAIKGVDIEIGTPDDAAKLVLKYQALIEKAGYSPKEKFVSTFEATPSGKSIIVLEFKDNSGFAAITALEEIRYFVSDKKDSSFSEIKGETKEVIGKTGENKEKFIESVDSALN